MSQQVKALEAKIQKGSDALGSLLTMAKASENAERYSDMCFFMKQLVDAKVKKGEDLTVEERNLLSVAYKNAVGARRASWRTLILDEYKANDLIAEYKKKVSGEMKDICSEVLSVLEDTLVPYVKKETATEADDSPKFEALVFYLKMAGDYYRYLSEIVVGEGYEKKAEKMYQEGTTLAEKHLIATHPIRLGLALNFSVCYYEILKNPTAACDMAKKAFDAAISKLDSLDEASYKDSTLIMQLLRDNLTLWTSANDKDGPEEIETGAGKEDE
eukprot:CAMPEP_0167747296 /NCGR_PEP_ID=MMETSP0110_2-20121227/4204_1 /TAXON_ID=629695 /ORGANISM="Gymnochlora sp., Strain CCMP2014" /LENGTH=271 /DNA_ID=CAMNT_0007632185 /DNA_START=22 /DNA_END=837 /DNA_ORIENTATION=+